jgi:hypothetical protein
MRLLVLFRLLGLAAVIGLLLALPLRAEDPAPLPDEWQSVITGQIQAFRDHDADAALGFAGAPFHETFADAREFYFMVMTSGYMPIITSRSHVFGAFELVGTGAVMQQVTLIDADQSLYLAIYQLEKETEGWRVEGVQLAKQPGIGV